MSLKIRNASINEILWIFSIRNRPGQNLGVRDAIMYQLADPSSFLVGTLNGKAICTASNIKYRTCACFGNFFVLEEYGNKGYGREMVQHIMSISKDFTLSCVAIPELVDYYVEMGWKISTSLTCYGGILSGETLFDCDKIVDVKNVPFDQILKYDRLHFPDDRKHYLMALLSLCCDKALAYIDSGIIQDFGVICQCELGYRIGPLFAENMNIAESLVWALCHPFQGSNIFMYSPGTNINTPDLAKKLQLKSLMQGYFHAYW